MSITTTINAFIDKALTTDRTYKKVMQAMRRRVSQFESREAMNLAALYQLPELRRQLDAKMDKAWAETDSYGGVGPDEIIIGGGLHAAIYAATRVANGHPEPLVITDTIGGAFAMSLEPVFTLNSRNRPGALGFPSENAALNVIPGAPVQPAMLSGAEFQTNAELAYVIRQTLARSAIVIQGRVDNIQIDRYGENSSRRFRVETEGDDVFYVDRVIDARGLGEPLATSQANGTTVLTFPQLMARMEQTFPLQGMNRVAVVGDGDSARCAVEALLGVGPTGHMSVAGLDWISQIDWYVGDSGPSNNCADWRQAERGRYQALGSFLNRPSNGIQRLRVIERYAEIVGRAPQVDGRGYDCVVLATGWNPTPFAFDEVFGSNAADIPMFPTDGGYKYGRRISAEEAYTIGVRAQLPFSDSEYAGGQVARIDNNRVAIFRLAPRTVALASTLSGLPAN